MAGDTLSRHFQLFGGAFPWVTDLSNHVPSAPGQHAPGRIVDCIRTRALQLTVDDRILAEYRSVLMGARLRKWVGEADARDLLAFLFLDSEHIVSTVYVEGLPDSGDVPFLEVAMTANVPLVTGNVKHFPERLRRGHDVMRPVEFVQSLR